MKQQHLLIVYLMIINLFSTKVSSQITPPLELPVYEGQSTHSINKDAAIKTGSYRVPLNDYNGTKLGDPLWENQKLLSNEVFDALGDYNISANIIDKEFDLDGKESRVTLKPTINPQRIVRVVQSGELKNGIPGENYKTQYLVSDSLSVTTSLKVTTELNSVLDLELFRAQSGITVQKISYVNSLDDYLSRTTEEHLAHFVGTKSDLEKHLSDQEKQVKEDADQVARDLLAREKALDDHDSPFSDEERIKLFLKGYFDPYKIAKTFIRIDSEKLKDDKVLRPGEILIKTYFRRIGPGINLSKDVFELGFRHFSYEVLRVGFKKEAPGKLLVKTQVEDGKSDETKFSIGVPYLPFKPHRTTMTKTDYEINEKLYRYDLSAQQSIDQLDNLFNHVGNPIRPQDYYEILLAKTKLIPGVIEQLFQRVRNSIDSAKDFRSKTELGFWGSRNYKTKIVEKNRSEDIDGNTTDDIIGEVQLLTKNRVRLIYYESDEDQNKKFRILSRKDAEGNPQTDLGFEYIFDDSQTKLKEYKEYLHFVSTALFLGDHVENTRANKIKKVLEERLAAKSLDSDSQSVATGIYFSEKFVDKVLSHKIEDLQSLVAKMILQPNSTWKNLVRLQSKLRVSGGDCAHLLSPLYKELIFGAGKVSCFKVNAIAGNIANAFSYASDAARTQSEIAQTLTRLVDMRDARPFVPMLMLQIGLLKSFDSKGMPVFKSLDDSFDSNEIEMSVTFSGDGIEGLLHEQIGEVLGLEVKEYKADFKIGTPNSTSPIIPQATLYLAHDNKSLNLNFNSILNTQKGNVLKGVLYRKTTGKKSEAVALFKVPNIQSAENMVSAKKATGKDFSYYVNLPWMKEADGASNLTIQFWLEDSEGQRLSESIAIRFKNL